MKRSRRLWVALAVFAALMTVAEAFAIQAAVRDTRRWLAGDEASDLRRATAVVTRMVTENLFSGGSECCRARIEVPQLIERADAILTGMGTGIPAVRQERRLSWKVVAIDI